MYTKTCRTCGEVKPLGDYPYQIKYGFRGDSPGSYRKDCKQCTAEKARAYRKSYTKGGGYRAGVDKLLYSACSCRVGDARARANKSRVEFNISTDFMYDLYIRQGAVCAISGIGLSLEKGAHHVLSIDKVDPCRGYTEDNVQWVSWAVNRAKGDLSKADFLEMCRAIVRCNDYPEMEYAQAGGSAVSGMPE